MGVRRPFTVVTQHWLFSLYSPEEKALIVGVFIFMACMWSLNILLSERAVTQVLGRQILSALGSHSVLRPH